jgi:thiamine-phosphate pyrophosphorylase
MAKPKESDPSASTPRLYLITPVIEDAAAFAGKLRDAMSAGDIAAVLLRLKSAGERDVINRVKVLAPIVQAKNAALLLDGQPEIAGRAGADGSHLTGIEIFSAAVEGLKPARIAGCGGLKTRDDAMTAGERGADYVMFGEPKPDGYRPPLDWTLERVEWWAQLFQIPCVGFASSLQDIGPLVRGGVEFVALGDALWDDPRGAAATLADVGRLLATPEPVP